MKVLKTKFTDVKIFKLKLYSDVRGKFYEFFNQKNYSRYPEIKKSFIQSNIAISKKNVLRGIHYQNQSPQSQLVTIIEGKIFYVIVDVRRTSKTFLKSETFILSSNKINQIFTPPGFACGYLVKSEKSILCYNVSKIYNNRTENGLKWNDKKLNIKWPKQKYIINKRDSEYKEIKYKLSNEFPK